MAAEVLVAGVGNIFLGDDGFGPEVARRLTRPGAQPLPDGVRVVDYGIRGLHLVYDLLEGYAALVLVDALPHDGPPGEIRVLQVGPDDLGRGHLDAHGMDPVAVLAEVQPLGGTLPDTYVVGCAPACVEEGIGLSAPVRDAIPAALDVVHRLLAELCATAGPDGDAYPAPLVARTGRR